MARTKEIEVKVPHTPGPWIVSGGVNHPVSETFGIKSEKGTWIAKCHPLNGTDDDKREAFANATLIAEAPQMYAVLVDLYGYLWARGIEKPAAKELIQRIVGSGLVSGFDIEKLLVEPGPTP